MCLLSLNGSPFFLTDVTTQTRPGTASKGAGKKTKQNIVSVYPFENGMRGNSIKKAFRLSLQCFCLPPEDGVNLKVLLSLLSPALVYKDTVNYNERPDGK